MIALTIFFDLRPIHPYGYLEKGKEVIVENLFHKFYYWNDLDFPGNPILTLPEYASPSMRLDLVTISFNVLL